MKQTYGTQPMKLLFSNDIINYDGFSYQGRDDWKGTDLHKEYTQLHIDYVNLKRQEFHTELGLDKRGKVIDHDKNIDKVQALIIG